MNRIIRFISSSFLMSILLMTVVLCLAIATFIENDLGADYVHRIIYGSWWFYTILLLLTVNLLGSIFTRKLYKLSKLPIFTFHLSFSIILLGSAVTHYFGYEGTMHLNEGACSNRIQLRDQVIQLQISYLNDTVPIGITTDIRKLKKFRSAFNLNGKPVSIRVKSIHENSYLKEKEDNNGMPIIEFIVTDSISNCYQYLTWGETKKLNTITFSFGDFYNNDDIHFSLNKDTIFIQSKDSLFYKLMDSYTSFNFSKNALLFHESYIYKINETTIIPQVVLTRAIKSIQPLSSENAAIKSSVAEFEISFNDTTFILPLWMAENSSAQQITQDFGQLTVTYSIGYKTATLPFSVRLDNFEIERYPGSNSPSSFSSYVTILKENEPPFPFHIYMNNILKLDGFRFFQSSYDQNEKGSMLSVNYDILGTTITYIGYFILFAGILISLFIKNSFFRNVNKLIKTLFIGFMIAIGGMPASAFANQPSFSDSTISIEHAEAFGNLLIQNTQGRTEPLSTFASEIARKLSRSESLYGLTPTQTFLEMSVEPQKWLTIPLIKITNKELQKRLGINGNFASYADFIDPYGQYKLQTDVNKAYNTAPAGRSKYDKAVMKADEQINICYSVFTGIYLRIFPQKDALSHHWLSPTEALESEIIAEDSIFIKDYIPIYYAELKSAKQTGNYALANSYLKKIKDYQIRYTTYQLPSDFKIYIEQHYYKWNVFKKLFPAYAATGLIYLILLIVFIISGKVLPRWLLWIINSIIISGFVFHTLGLISRWYISGHAPMSNGYESMIFVSWGALLVGILFSKQSPFALAATSVLGGMTLMVAQLSFMDPEITNLVPVLKSYWLTLHVSIITGSYSFLGFGAILGLINQLLYIFKCDKNNLQITNTIKQLTIINHRTLILGLYFLTIGTFLGAIWANESWGRYWGWDPKETWSLITIIVYVFITHARFIPGIAGMFTFNVLALYGFSSVLMTYFGVNYYLSGMHSYAAGDPVPVPAFVYYTILSLIIISVMAWWRYSKIKINASNSD